MTEKKLKSLAQAAGYKIEKGWTHSEEGGKRAGETGWEIINQSTDEAETVCISGETWHFAFTLADVEAFLKDVYEQAGMDWEQESADEADLEDVVKAAIELNGVITGVCKQSVELNGDLTQTLKETMATLKETIEGLRSVISDRERELEEEKDVRTQAYNIIWNNVPADLDATLEDCRPMFDRVQEGLKAEWDNATADTYELRLKLFMIMQILETTNMDIHADCDEPDYTEELDELAAEIVKFKIRVMKQEEADAAAE